MSEPDNDDIGPAGRLRSWLKLKRKDVETTVEALIQGLRNTIEYIHSQDAHDREDRVLLHRPRHTETAEADQAERRRRQNIP